MSPFVPLAETTRSLPAGAVGDLRESLHFGAACLCDADGTVVRSWGDRDLPIFARSSLKPLQALALFESGAADRWNFSEIESALACASHQGEEIHVDAVKSLLGRLGLDEAALACGVMDPARRDDLWAMATAGRRPGSLHHCCSGKHAGFLSTALHLRAAPSSYLDPSGPVQRLVLGNMEEMTGEKTRFLGTDGCAAPAPAFSLRSLATAFARIADPSAFASGRRAACTRIARAMVAHPHFIAGTGDFTTAFLEAGRGRWIAKSGAEGIFAISFLEKGWGFVMKISDGNPRAVPPALGSLLGSVALLEETDRAVLESHLAVSLKNASGTPVGRIRSLPL